jgi:hypothetical protein
MRRRLFTLEEANRLLPWLREKLAELDQYHEALTRTQAHLAEVHRKSRTNGAASNQQNARLAHQHMESADRRANAIIEAIAEQGIILRDAVRGLVDFPSLRDGREVYLCWLRGEQSIGHWHEVDAGFAGRRPL